MKFGAVTTLRQLAARRDMTIRIVERTAEGGAVLEALDLSRPVTAETLPVRLTILPSGDIDCDSPECTALAEAA